MIVKCLVLAVLAGTAAASMASAQPYWTRAHTRVVIHPRMAGSYPGWAEGSNAYPAHRVPLAAYPSPGGIGITFEPFGWSGSSGRRGPY
jgi:hypothetical protein